MSIMSGWPTVCNERDSISGGVRAWVVLVDGFESMCFLSQRDLFSIRIFILHALPAGYVLSFWTGPVCVSSGLFFSGK